MGSALLIAFGYLLGSIPTGVLLARTAGIDVRSEGSRNIGATNVARTAGRSLGILTLIGDFAKGLVPVLLARAVRASTVTIAAVAVAALVGHVYSVFLRFRGGKGVATGFGVILALAPAAAVIPLGIFVGVVAVTRIVSLASLCATGSAPLAVWAVGYPSPLVAAAGVIAALIVWKHHENISRLLAGTEHRFRAKS